MTDDQTPAGLTAIEVRIPVAAPVSPDEADTLANIAAEAVRRLVQRGGPICPPVELRGGP